VTIDVSDVIGWFFAMAVFLFSLCSIGPREFVGTDGPMVVVMKVTDVLGLVAGIRSAMIALREHRTRVLSRLHRLRRARRCCAFALTRRRVSGSIALGLPSGPDVASVRPTADFKATQREMFRPAHVLSKA
jgi:hypothetical protein